MKNQNDWIFAGVAILLLLIVAGVSYGKKRVVIAPAPPTQVVTTPAVLPVGDVKMGSGGGASGAAPGEPGGKVFGKRPM